MPGVIPAAIAIGSAAIGASQKNKAQKQAMSAAEEQQQRALEEQRRLEEKFGLTPGELERQDRMFALEKQRQAELQGRADTSGEQLLRQQGPITDQLLNEIMGRQGMTGQQLFEREGDINKQLVEQIANFDEQAFAPELALTLQGVNQQANRRGVYGGLPQGGINFEMMGRAGVDLAVRKATERLNQQQALSQAFVNLSTGARGEAANVGQSALDQSQRSRDEISNFLANLQQLEAASKGRAAQVGQVASGQAQNTMNQFGTVPLEFAAQNYGQAQGLQNQGLAAIGQTGGNYIDSLSSQNKPAQTPSNIDYFTSSDKRPVQATVDERVGRMNFPQYNFPRYSGQF